MLALNLERRFRQFARVRRHGCPQDLLPEKRLLRHPNLAKAVGSDPLAARIASLQPDCHIFGCARPGVCHCMRLYIINNFDGLTAFIRADPLVACTASLRPDCHKFGCALQAGVVSSRL